MNDPTMPPKEAIEKGLLPPLGHEFEFAGDTWVCTEYCYRDGNKYDGYKQVTVLWFEDEGHWMQTHPTSDQPNHWIKVPEDVEINAAIWPKSLLD